MAYPFVTAFVVLPTASRASVDLRTSGGRPAISAMPPALSVTGPKASRAPLKPAGAPTAATAGGGAGPEGGGGPGEARGRRHGGDRDGDTEQARERVGGDDARHDDEG